MRYLYSSTVCITVVQRVLHWQTKPHLFPHRPFRSEAILHCVDWYGALWCKADSSLVDKSMAESSVVWPKPIPLVINEPAAQLILKVLYGISYSQSFCSVAVLNSSCQKRGGPFGGSFAWNINCDLLIGWSVLVIGISEHSTVLKKSSY